VSSASLFYKFSQLEFLIKHHLLKALGLRQELFDIITSPYDFAIRHCG
jgi:hypothetical protein